ncbi:hypothetical protein BRADO3652 [Bradyrhizobium sp. ORS 278]|uniref:hypothetical protein n=1 Tax=Bradyrhizobium sp. (strain ORS 278) TaxID=114615 RepID=UPI0001508F58|nr:hypothetical protein [Bradyrhizobium sp. ORS 278]CAL77429.1 hypothetical protein BRADO3652 [Bradyrhizobium sp. ORS 278]
MDIAQAADAADKFVEEAAKIEPTVAAVTSMFVPGAAPVVATVQPMIAVAIPFVEKALQDIAAHKGGDALGALAELIGHLTRDMPNSPILSPIGATIPSPG